MVFGGFVELVTGALATDVALVILSMLFGLLLGMLWSGRAFPRRLARRQLPSIDLLRR